MNYREILQDKKDGWHSEGLPLLQTVGLARKDNDFAMPEVSNATELKATEVEPAREKFNPSAQLDELAVESKVIEEMETDYFTSIIHQNGDEYVGKIKFVSDTAGKRSITLVDFSLSRLRLSMRHASQQGISKEDRAFVSNSFDAPSNFNPSFDFRPGQ
jgi:hypothetical protein